MNKVALFLLALVLTLDKGFYHVTGLNDADVVHLIIWSDSNEDPYFQLQEVEVKPDQAKVDIPRQELPPASYVIQAFSYRWEGCPEKCELQPLDYSPTVIIHIPGEKP